MGILLDGFRKQKRYTTNANGDHQLVSTWTHSDTVIMPDGTPLSEAVLGDGNDAVKQTETVNDNDNYEILLSQTADDVTKIEGARKSSKLKFNPYSSSLMMTTRNGQSTLTPNQLTISGVGGEGSLTNNTLVLSNNGISTTYSNSDIVTDNHNTWDGTNTSLKTAVTNAKGTVTQTETTTSGNYELLFSGTGDDTTRTEGAKKSTYLKFNPTNKSLNIVNEYNDTNYKSVTISPTGVNVLSAENGVHNLRYGADDIVFNAPSNPPTWDGTNTSLKAAIAAAAGAGGTEAVYLPLADYEELTTAEKEDPTKIYFVINEGTKVSPTLSVDDGNVSASSSQGGTSAPWKVLDGTSMEKGVEPWSHVWVPWGQNGGEWWQYNFANGNKFSKISFKIASSSTPSNTMGFKVEASNDGETWTPITYGISDYIDYYLPGYDTSVGNGFNWVDVTLILDCPINYSKIRLCMDKSVGYPYSNNGVIVNDVQIFAAAASNKSSIYYKNVLYNPDELPVTTISDVGKVLKVNEDGLWDKGDAPIPDVNAVQVPPVIFDNGSLKKVNEVNGFPGLEKVYLSAEEYDALSSDEKNDLSKIYYISQYKYFSNSNNTMIVRRDANSDVWIFFNGWVYDPSAETNLPAGAEVYATEVGNSYGYSDPASQTRPVQNQPCWVRFNGTKASAEFASEYQIRNDKWYPNVAGVYTSPVYGKLKIGENVGSYAYSDPFDAGETISIYYGGKQYTEYEPTKPYVELTQAEYDALPLSKESDGIMHFVTDAQKIILNGIQYG